MAAQPHAIDACRQGQGYRLLETSSRCWNNEVAPSAPVAPDRQLPLSWGNQFTFRIVERSNQEYPVTSIPPLGQKTVAHQSDTSARRSGGRYERHVGTDIAPSGITARLRLADFSAKALNAAPLILKAVLKFFPVLRRPLKPFDQHGPPLVDGIERPVVCHPLHPEADGRRACKNTEPQGQHDVFRFSSHVLKSLAR